MLEVLYRREIPTWSYRFRFDKKRHRGRLLPAEGMSEKQTEAEVKKLKAATYVLLTSKDLRAVQELLCHSSVKTAQKYTHVLSEQKDAVMNGVCSVILAQAANGAHR